MEEKLEPTPAPRVPRITRRRKKKKEPEFMDEVKSFLCSKTIWVNFLVLVAFLVQKNYGFVISEDVQMQLLTIINIILRFWTHKPIKW